MITAVFTMTNFAIYLLVAVSCLLYTIARIYFHDGHIKALDKDEVMARVIFGLFPGLNLFFGAWILVIVVFIVFKNMLMTCSWLDKFNTKETKIELKTERKPSEREYRILKRFRNYRTGRDRLIHRIGKRRRRHK